MRFVFTIGDWHQQWAAAPMEETDDVVGRMDALAEANMGLAGNADTAFEHGGVRKAADREHLPNWNG